MTRVKKKNCCSPFIAGCFSDFMELLTTPEFSIQQVHIRTPRRNFIFNNLQSSHRNRKGSDLESLKKGLSPLKKGGPENYTNDGGDIDISNQEEKDKSANAAKSSRSMQEAKPANAATSDRRCQKMSQPTPLRKPAMPDDKPTKRR
ncbi:predicted protein [Arabidopsis lyrata subsp. lyrata]|uniref:Predicted protein n=1 Tax=Arabidopsis lyrata subsp. lyrata TaxID=81972 RepID=D7KBV7_ARALL|nr:predicted protein [Arabidopsis lyrata subsp. lyrata]